MLFKCTSQAQEKNISAGVGFEDPASLVLKGVLATVNRPVGRITTTSDESPYEEPHSSQPQCNVCLDTQCIHSPGQTAFLSALVLLKPHGIDKRRKYRPT